MAKKPTQTPPPTTIHTPIEPAVDKYGHRTASIPGWAHKELTLLRQEIIDQGGVQALPEELRVFAQEQMVGGEAFTRGLVFGVACKALRVQIRERR